MGNYDNELPKPKNTLVATLRTARGSASPEAKLHVSRWYGSKGVEDQFMYAIVARLEATDLDVFDVPEQPGKKQARIIYELDVKKGTLAN